MDFTLNLTTNQTTIAAGRNKLQQLITGMYGRNPTQKSAPERQGPNLRLLHLGATAHHFMAATDCT